MYWKGILSQALRDTKPKDWLAIISGAIGTGLDYALQVHEHLVAVRPAIISIGIGLLVYVLALSVRFVANALRAIGRDQDSKQADLAKLLEQSHPELSQKAIQAIAKLESAIQGADTIASHPPTTREVIESWVQDTADKLARIIGQSSDLYQQFENGVEQEPIELQLNREQALLFRRVAVLRDIIDEIKRQRILVLAS